MSYRKDGSVHVFRSSSNELFSMEQDKSWHLPQSSIYFDTMIHPVLCSIGSSYRSIATSRSPPLSRCHEGSDMISHFCLKFIYFIDIFSSPGFARSKETVTDGRASTMRCHKVDGNGATIIAAFRPLRQVGQRHPSCKNFLPGSTGSAFHHWN